MKAIRQIKYRILHLMANWLKTHGSWLMAPDSRLPTITYLYPLILLLIGQPKLFFEEVQELTVIKVPNNTTRTIASFFADMDDNLFISVVII